MTNYDDDTFITLADAEAAALATGQLRGVDNTYSNDGIQWLEHWLPTDEHPKPVLARATVVRLIDGDRVTTRVVVSWAEYYPADTDRAESWDQLPTIMLRKVAIVSALRSAFRDVIGDRYERAELDQSLIAAATRDWSAALAGATTAEAVRELWAEARAARAVTVPLEREIKARLRELDLDAAATASASASASAAVEVAVMPEPRVTPATVAAVATRSSRKRSRR